MYASEEYQAVAASAVDQLERLYRSRGGSARLTELTKTFHQATVLAVGADVLNRAHDCYERHCE